MRGLRCRACGFPAAAVAAGGVVGALVQLGLAPALPVAAGLGLAGVAGALSLAGLLGVEAWAPPGLRARGLRLAVAGGLGLFVALQLLGLVWGFAVNGFVLRLGVAGVVFHVLRRLGLVAAAAAAAWLAPGPLGLAASMLLVGSLYVSPGELRVLLEGGLGLGWVVGEALPGASLAAAVYALARLYTPLAGFAFYTLGVAVGYMLYPLAPRAPGPLLGLAVSTVSLLVATAAYEAALPRATGSRGSRALASVAAAAVLGAAVVLLFYAGYYPLAVATGSMEPLLEPGDLVVVKRVPPEAVEPGDVVAYLAGDGSIVVHRVVRIEDGGGVLV
ncbi:MAG: hypothetical protein GXO15_02140, partial [Crenarchaeota archaeon]|nr:hypothetical protein [Thermoproteota archaeon]